jgi:hypothetical protein
VLSFERFGPDGRTTIRWDRVMRAERLNDRRLPLESGADVMHMLSFERALSGPVAPCLTLRLVHEFNRHFGGDANSAEVGIAVDVGR